MVKTIIGRLRGLGAAQKVGLVGAAATTAVLIGTGAAHAATSTPAPTSPATSPSSPSAPSTSQTPKVSNGPDTDNVQSGAPVRRPDRSGHRGREGRCR